MPLGSTTEPVRPLLPEVSVLDTPLPVSENTAPESGRPVVELRLYSTNSVERAVLVVTNSYAPPAVLVSARPSTRIPSVVTWTI